jgi:hypothetical protein
LQNIEDYGASPSATPTDNKLAIEAALAVGPIYIPPKTFIVDQIVTASPPRISGDGWNSKLISTSSTSGIKVDVVGGHTDTLLKDFYLAPQVIGQGTRGIEFIMSSTGYMLNSKIEGLFVGEFAQEALVFDNSIVKVDGFFTSQINRCWLTKGFKGIKIGDNIGIERCTITGGTGVGISADFVPGANRFSLLHNSLTTRGGAMSIYNALAAIIEGNNCEHPSYLGGYVMGPTQNSIVYLYACDACDVNHNTVLAMLGQPVTTAYYGILFDHCSRTMAWRNAVGAANIRTIDWRGASPVGPTTNAFVDTINI